VKNKFYLNRAGRIRENGFTIIEILIALAIFSIGVLGVAALQIQSTSSTAKAGNITTNLRLAEDRIEKLTSLSYNDPRLVEGTTTLDQDVDLIDNDADGEIDEEDETGFITATWNVEEITPKAGSDLYNYKKVTVTIQRDGPNSGDDVILQRNIPNIVGD